MTIYRIRVDHENNAEGFWDALGSHPELRHLPIAEIADECVVTAKQLAEIKALPGWATGPDYARTALLVEEVDILETAAARTAPTNLETLLAAVRDGRYSDDMDQLPTFGGAEPSDTNRVWSWDAERLLVGTCAGDMQIVTRGER